MESGLSAWALSVVGVIILILIVDIVIPEGDTNKYVKSVLSIITVCVIASPIPKLLSGGEYSFPQSDDVVVDSVLLDNLYTQRIEFFEKGFDKVLNNQNIDNVDFQIVSKNNNSQVDFEKIILFVKKSGIKDKDTNIFISELFELTSNYFDIDSNKVVIIYV
ncbi:MAG: stage III sporulation protein AF [Clostridia bacterium]